MQPYFKTGKTIVIDDQYNEALPLLNALSKNHIPFLYTQGKPNSEFPLPNKTIEDAQYYSLVFLDLNLDFKFASGGISDDDEKTFKSTHANLFDTIIKNRNRSFILVIWSNEEENFKDIFLKIFKDDEKYKTQKKPYKIITLTKTDFFKQNQEGIFEFITDKEKDLKDKINTQLKDLEAFELFCEWERIISQSVGDAIDDFMSLINPINESEQEDSLAYIITSLAIAYSGVEGFLKYKTNEEKTDSVFLALTQILNDDIDRNVLYKRQRGFTKWKAFNKEDIKNVYSIVNPTLLNKKLLVFQPNRKDLTGSLYKQIFNKKIFEEIFLDSFAISSISKDFIKQYKRDYLQLSTENINKIEKKYCLSILSKNITLVEVNISPLCDVVQNKIINHRLITGLLITADLNDKLNKADYFYKSPTFSHEGKDVFLGFDFRTLSSCKRTEIESKDYILTLRTNLVNDIQTKLAAHVSRLGVFNL